MGFSIRANLQGALIALAAATAMLSAAPGASAQTLQPVSLITFPGGFNWPIWVALEKGYFAQNSIDVKLTPTPSSVFQLTGLIEGKFDIGVTAIDNVIAYMEGQGEVPVATQPDLFVFMGGDNGLLSLVSVPEIKSIADLKGKTVSVDAVTTGYAFVLFDLLKRNGLDKGDYKIERAGGVLSRWEALKEKKHDATMLLTPFEIVAKANGFNVLQPAIDVYGNYQGLSGAARRSWARDNRPKLEAYIRGYLAGLAWLYQPGNKDEAIAILRKNLPQMTPELAAQSYAVLVNPKGFAPKAELDIAGVRKALELRSQYGEPKKELTDPMKYYDPSYYEAASK
ncbi:MAG: ABC transporter substrate-binding protein [Pseudomonadota bacterium]|nr:ABC transporter substrate-binding protein [Pseudomonadota bacterium]